jgi:hypothetical protein
MAITPSDGYLTPIYIQYNGIIANALKYRQIQVYDDSTPVDEQDGKVYIKDINSWLAQGEVQAIKGLQNYVAFPLTWDTGAEFNSDLSSTPQYQPTQTRILSYFINYGLLIITNNYYTGISDKSTGKSVYDFYKNLVNKFESDAVTLNQTTDPLNKNLFYGLKTVANASARIPKGAQTPQMQGGNGGDAEYMAQNSIPNFRYGVRW